MKKGAVIVAGGTGTRCNTEIPKQFTLINGKPVFIYSIEKFVEAFPEIEIAVVVSKEYEEQVLQWLGSFFGDRKFIVTEGGKERQNSVFNGLQALAEKNLDLVATHDAARPLVSTSLIKHLFAEAELKGNAVPVIPPRDSTIMQGHDSQWSYISRDQIKLVQAPQVFNFKSLVNIAKTIGDNIYTDESSLMGQAGVSIHYTDGDTNNFKITYEQDIYIAKLLLSSI